MFIAAALSWQTPQFCSDCAKQDGPDAQAQQLWSLKSRIEAPPLQKRSPMSGPAQPEDLFKNFPQRRSSPERAAGSPPVESPPAAVAEGVGLPSTVGEANPESLPSIDSLFKGLERPKRRST